MQQKICACVCVATVDLLLVILQRYAGKSITAVSLCLLLYFWLKYDFGQKYYALQVRTDWGSNFELMTSRS